MRIKLTVSTEGGQDGVAQINEFVAKADSGTSVSYDSFGKTYKFSWKVVKLPCFSARGFFPIPANVDGDVVLACHIPKDSQEQAIKDWTFDEKIMCKSRSDLKFAHAIHSDETMYAKYCKINGDFVSPLVRKLSDNAYLYSMITYESVENFLSWFKLLSKQYPLLSFSVNFKQSDWQPGDEIDVINKVEYEFENGRLSNMLKKKLENSKKINRSWREGGPRRNIYNVIDRHLDENGNLRQPPGEMPNGNRMDYQESPASRRGQSLSNIMTTAMDNSVLPSATPVTYTTESTPAWINNFFGHSHALSEEELERQRNELINMGQRYIRHIVEGENIGF